MYFLKIILFTFFIISNPLILKAQEEKCSQKANANLAFLQRFKLPFNKPDFKHNEMYCEYAYNLAITYSFLNKDSAVYYINELINCNPQQVEMINDYFLKRMTFNFSTKQLKTIQAGFDKQYGSNKFHALIYQILKMTGADQSVRMYNTLCSDKELKDDWRMIDSTNLIKAKEIFNQYSFPTISMVGEEISNDYFLLVQHADRDLSFQKKVMRCMDTLITKKEIKGENYALLKDRIMVAETGKQLYGTQLKNNKLYPIIDSIHVDQRRKELGMTSLKEYLKSFQSFSK